MYAKLKDEYLRSFGGAFFLSDNPMKKSIVLSKTEDGLPNEFVNVMSSKLTNGTFGTKVIKVSEETGDMDSITVVFGHDGQTQAIDSVELTRIRCGLMAALSIDLFFNGEVGRVIGFIGGRPAKKIGFIGGGRTNLWTAKILNQLFGCNSFVIVGSESNPYPALLSEFSALGSASITTRAWGYDDLRGCDVVISCTNATNAESVIDYEDVSGPKLFISQDGGYIFGESFRKVCVSVSDYPSQILSHVETEFPWDDVAPSIMEPLVSLCEIGVGADALGKAMKPTAVYLYGIALADVVLAEYMIENGGIDGES